MCNSGIEDFESVDFRTLREGMKRAAGLGLPVAVHAESETMTRRITEERAGHGRTAVHDFLDSRPVAAELEAIRAALDMAGETRCSLQIVHVSCGEGIALVKEARQKGADATCETCPHYLTLTDEDMVKIGATAKCAPPLRSAREQEKLWRTPAGRRYHQRWIRPFAFAARHEAGRQFLQNLGRDFQRPAHAAFAAHGRPFPPASASCRCSAVCCPRAWRPDSNCPKTRGAWPRAMTRTSPSSASTRSSRWKTEDLFYRHRHTPYAGRKLRGRVLRTLLRGHTVFKDGQIASKPLGCLITPVT